MVKGCFHKAQLSGWNGSESGSNPKMESFKSCFLIKWKIIFTGFQVQAVEGDLYR